VKSLVFECTGCRQC